MKLFLTILALITLHQSFCQNTITVKQNIEEVEIINETKTDSVTANIQSSIVRFNNENQGVFNSTNEYFFYDNKVIIFNRNYWVKNNYYTGVTNKLMRYAKKNREKFLKKIAALKQKGKLDYEIFDATIKEINVNRVNYITEGGYSYYQINRTTKDTLAQKIILPTTGFVTSFKYSYEVIINGEKFTSPILYNTFLTDNEIIRSITTAIKNKIQETIPVGYYIANKNIDKQKFALLFSDYSYFTNTAYLKSSKNPKLNNIKLGFDIKNNNLKIESDLPIFTNEGKYNKKSSKILFKSEIARITFSKK